MKYKTQYETGSVGVPPKREIIFFRRYIIVFLGRAHLGEEFAKKRIRLFWKVISNQTDTCVSSGIFGVARVNIFIFICLFFSRRRNGNENEKVFRDVL